MMDAAIHPYPDNSSQAPTVAHPLNTTIAVADYRKLVALLGEAFDGGPSATGIGAADPLRRVRRRVRDPRRQGSALHGNRADDDETRRRADAGRLLRAGARARLLPTERRGHAALPLAGRARTSWQSGSSTSTALRRRACRAFGGARSYDRRLDHALSRRRARRATDVPPLRYEVGGKAASVPGQPDVRSRLSLLGSARNAVTHSVSSPHAARPSRRAGPIDLGSRALGLGAYRYPARASGEPGAGDAAPGAVSGSLALSRNDR